MTLNPALLTAREALRLGIERLRQAGIAGAPLEMSLILARALATTRLGLYLDLDRPLSDPERAAARELLARRLRHEPLAYILGVREFYGLDFEVGPAVLIPRPETELLVDAVLEWLRGLPPDAPDPLLADIGTGSGAIAVAAAQGSPRGRWLACDVSPEALAVARRNAERHGVAGRVALRQGSLLEPIGEPLDALAANLPYVAQSDAATLAPEVARHEPALALFGGDDGLTLLRELIAQAPARLRPGAPLWLEIGAGQGPAVAAMLHEAGAFEAIEVRRDLAGLERLATARRRAANP